MSRCYRMPTGYTHLYQYLTSLPQSQAALLLLHKIVTRLNVLAMNSHSFFNAQVWDLRSQGLSIQEIADQANLDPEVVVQRLGFDGFNKHTVTEAELEEAGLDWSVAQKHGLEVSN